MVKYLLCRYLILVNKHIYDKNVQFISINQ